SLYAQTTSNRFSERPDSIATHKVVLDDQSKLISWIVPHSKAYDQFLHQRWNFIKTKVPYSPGPAPRSSYPQYYFYCDYDNKNFGVPGSWMNDIGEKIPNWFENARLYYAYTGDASVMDIIKDFVDYTIEHGTSPSSFAWPDFPYTTTNAGDLDFRGFTDSKKLILHEIQVDHAGDMGLTYYRLFLFTGDVKYKTAAIKVANTLAKNARKGSATRSVWPYRVVMSTGKITAEYGANWTGCYSLLDGLVKANLGNVAAYQDALVKARDFILQYPMKTGYWTDGHSDTDVNSHTYRSNLSASNAKLYMFDHPEFDPDFKTHLPELIKWTEEFFVFRCVPGEPAVQWGANIVGEQDMFLPKMDYQTARYAAECARWYAVSGDETYREKAYRSLNWVTYCNDGDGMAFESPLSKDVSSWWSDCYGECPRMFYHVFAAVPEWAPPGENHILYAEGVLKDVSYQDRKVEYTSTVNNGTEFLRLAFKPEIITIDGKNISLRQEPTQEGYLLKDLGHGDYALTISHKNAGVIHISR
ncbi:MAG: hypothetical protein AMS23_02165, partial [Bacteroides sp. SM1_62]